MTYRELLSEENNEIMRDVRARQAAVEAEIAKYPSYSAYRAARRAEDEALGIKHIYADRKPDPKVLAFIRELRASGEDLTL